MPVSQPKLITLPSISKDITTNILPSITRESQNNRQDVAVIKFEGGQILLYLGQHHLFIQTKLLEKAYVKVKLWQQEELVGRVKIVSKI